MGCRVEGIILVGLGDSMGTGLVGTGWEEGSSNRDVVIVLLEMVTLEVAWGSKEVKMATLEVASGMGAGEEVKMAMLEVKMAMLEVASGIEGSEEVKGASMATPEVALGMRDEDRVGGRVGVMAGEGVMTEGEGMAAGREEEEFRGITILSPDPLPSRVPKRLYSLHMHTHTHKHRHRGIYSAHTTRSMA